MGKRNSFHITESEESLSMEFLWSGSCSTWRVELWVNWQLHFVALNLCNSSRLREWLWSLDCWLRSVFISPLPFLMDSKAGPDQRDPMIEWFSKPHVSSLSTVSKTLWNRWQIQSTSTRCATRVNYSYIPVTGYVCKILVVLFEFSRGKVQPRVQFSLKWFFDTFSKVV